MELCLRAACPGIKRKAREKATLDRIDASTCWHQAHTLKKTPALTKFNTCANLKMRTQQEYKQWILSL